MHVGDLALDTHTGKFKKLVPDTVIVEAASSAGSRLDSALQQLTRKHKAGSRPPAT